MSMHRRSRTGSGLRFACGAAAIVLLGVHAASAATGGAGAPLPWSTVQAEHSPTNGALIGEPVFGRTVYPSTVVAESSGRRAVVLDRAGEYVEFIVPKTSNAIVVRYSLPDTRDGLTYSWPLKLSLFAPATNPGTLPIYHNQPDLSLTTRFSHYYGSLAAGGNTPSAGNHRHYYDEVSRRLTRTVNAGDKVRLELASTFVNEPYVNAQSVTIDFVDFELVPAAKPQPAGFLNVRDYGAGVGDSTPAIQEAVNQGRASGLGVYIPPGEYSLSAPIRVNNVTIRGAGIWHTILTGNGFRGNSASSPSTNVRLFDMQIRGNVQSRCSSCASGISGAIASGSDIHDIWIEHTYVGALMSGPTTPGLTFARMRVRNTTADGIHLGGLTGASVYFSHIRNTGDDGLSMGASATRPSLGVANLFSSNTVELPIHANGIGVYGGTNNKVEFNRVVDAGYLVGGGIYLANRYGQGAPSVAINSNTLLRSGSLAGSAADVPSGALWFDAFDEAMQRPITVTNLLIQDSHTYGIEFISSNATPGSPASSPNYPISGVSFTDVTVQGRGTGILVMATAAAASFQSSSIGKYWSTDSIFPIKTCYASAQFADRGLNNFPVDGAVEVCYPRPR